MEGIHVDERVIVCLTAGNAAARWRALPSLASRETVVEMTGLKYQLRFEGKTAAIVVQLTSVSVYKSSGILFFSALRRIKDSSNF